MGELRFRQVHLDFHTSEYIPDVAKDFQAEDFARILEEANVDSVTCFARCHHGWLYYPSKKFPELIHPALTNHNLLPEQIQACHRHNIRVPIYTTVQWDGRIMREHPEWLAVSADGKYIDTQGVPKPHFYYTICLNSGYRDFFKEHLQDIIDVIGVQNIDGFFMDILFKADCDCPHCQAKMKPFGYDHTKKSDRLAYSIHMLEEFKTEITAFIRERVPDAEIFYNSSHVGPASKNSFKDYTHLELESLPSGGWGYDHFPATARYARTLGKDFIGMTGKFHTYWGDFHSLKNEAALAFECFNMLAMGAGCSIGEQLHPSGKLSKGSYDLIGHVYSQVKEKEPYCRGAVPKAEIAVLTPEEFYTEEEHDLGLPSALVGAVRMLQELSYQFDIIDSTTPMDKYPLIILPDDILFRRDVEEKLKDYIAKGGKVIGTYHSCLDTKNGSDSIYGVSYIKESPYYRDFILPNDIIGKDLNREEYVMYLRAAETRVNDAEVLMDSIQPYFNREGNTFCSHQHTPSSGRKGYAAAARKGNVIYFAHPVFRIYRKNCANWCKQIMKDAIELLLPYKLASHNGPSTVITSLNRQESENRDILHVLHYITEKRSEDIYTIEDVLPLYDVTFRLYVGDRNVRSVQLVPQGQNLAFGQKDGYLTFTPDKIEGHAMVSIQYSSGS
ncbi:hypothetical protein FL966_04825 [Caproiciproducens galactitolivorans]|uniref:Beta-galactosidase trimerization domain protein n=1 Tax=Caproiciproducens galactitolivorans TaxID=642589 RepID=A0A4Z0Y254_9FIRM|nr:beta-galactosidase trimerization domain-containing protein [Caproiciproducens galactitolivorans]QEY34430.1 hypothetical protein FL966_04825 [Caproiciproducens galactitolivorans]TGJ77794.1 beta-galactosidase trimerization domain protein [Caproiciproducens galactitolivorans]